MNHPSQIKYICIDFNDQYSLFKLMYFTNQLQKNITTFFKNILGECFKYTVVYACHPQLLRSNEPLDIRLHYRHFHLPNSISIHIAHCKNLFSEIPPPPLLREYLICMWKNKLFSPGLHLHLRSSSKPSSSRHSLTQEATTLLIPGSCSWSEN